MVVPGCTKACFSGENDQEIYEDFGQKCEFMDRKGQIYRLFFHLNSTFYRIGRLNLSKLQGFGQLIGRLNRLVFLLFQPSLQNARRRIAAP